MTEIKNARKKLEDKLGSVKSETKATPTSAPVAPAKPAANKFVRVAIQEESDEDEAETPDTFKVSNKNEEEPTIEEAPKS